MVFYSGNRHTIGNIVNYLQHTNLIFGDWSIKAIYVVTSYSEYFQGSKVWVVNADSSFVAMMEWPFLQIFISNNLVCGWTYIIYIE
jgi:hypothetical protein